MTNAYEICYQHRTIRIGRQTVQFKMSVKYLGILLEQNFMFETHRGRILALAKVSYHSAMRIFCEDLGVLHKV